MNNAYKISSSNKINALGITLVLIGVPMGMYLNFFTNTNLGSSLIMFLSIIFILYNNKISFHIKREYKFVFFFQLIMLLYWYFSEQATIQYLLFHLYVLALIFSLSIIKNIKLEQIIKYTFYLSTVLTIIGIIVCLQGLVTGSTAWELRQENENYALEPFTIANGALIGYFAGLCINSGNRNKKIIISAILIADFYLIWLCGKRTPLLLLIICSLIYYFKIKSLSPENILLSLIKISILLFIGLIFLFQNNDFKQEFIKYSTNIFYGIQNILGNKDVSDSTGSAIVRYEYRTMALEYIQYRFDIVNYICGNGYMEKWKQIDNPILQAYLDMGVIGIIGYTWIVIITPLKKMFFHQINNQQLFFIFCCLYNILSSVSSGNPYMYQKYTLICLLIFSFSKQKKFFSFKQ